MKKPSKAQNKPPQKKPSKAQKKPPQKKTSQKKTKEPLNWWKCSECGYVLQAVAAPEECPSCKQKCAFIDATCYTPECGGPGNLDPQVLQPKR